MVVEVVAVGSVPGGDAHAYRFGGHEHRISDMVEHMRVCVCARAMVARVLFRCLNNISN